MREHHLSSSQRWHGLLLGIAVGDSVGLPAEGLSARRIARWYRGQWRQRLLGSWGMASDDTEHAILTCQCLLRAQGDAQRFSHCLAWALRLWILALPAGVGWATLRAGIKLWLGFSPQHAGVFSAGNGPAMRAAVIGAFWANDHLRLRTQLALATHITHTDPKAFTGAYAVAMLAAWIVRSEPVGQPAWDEIEAQLITASEDKTWYRIVQTMRSAVSAKWSVAEFSSELSQQTTPEISGYIYHTVPVAVYAWYHHWGDFQGTLEALWSCGGDTDTAGAIGGALAGALCGPSRIPPQWIAQYRDWPYSGTMLEKLATRLNQRQDPLNWPWLIVLLARNVVFLLVVLAHGIRRLLPPW